MTNIEIKVENLRELMERYGIFQQDDEVGDALKEVEDALKAKTVEVFTNEVDAVEYAMLALRADTRKVICDLQKNSIAKIKGDTIIIIDEFGILD